ncbi:MAG TPA: hypothetical protein VF381_05425, partial [Thermoanaerobaculia bacterium]
DVPVDYISPTEARTIRRQAIRSIVTGDFKLLRTVLIALVSVVEPALRRLAVDSVRRSYPDLATAARARVISQAAANKDLEHLTLGEVRDILRGLATAGSVAVPPIEALDELQRVIDVRNRLVHGDLIEPEAATSATLTLLYFVGRNQTSLFER